jgi:opacity protein-like surface antigen
MSFVLRAAPIAALMTVVAALPGLAQPQSQEPRVRLSITPAVATVGGDAEFALGGTVGYRFSEHFWFEGDITWIDAAAGGVRDFDFDFDGDRPGLSSAREMLAQHTARFGSGRYPGMSFPNLPNLPNLPDLGRVRASVDGRTVVGTLGVRYELPVQTTRFRPYLSGGLGINNTSQEFRVGPGGLAPGLDLSVSQTGYAFNAGAGASVRVFRGMWADVDAKYFRLSRERNVMRLGGGVSVRF